MKKCSETATGKHIFTDRHTVSYESGLAQDGSGRWHENECYYPECALCGFVDDRKIFEELSNGVARNAPNIDVD